MGNELHEYVNKECSHSLRTSTAVVNMQNHFCYSPTICIHPSYIILEMGLYQKRVHRQSKTFPIPRLCMLVLPNQTWTFAVNNIYKYQNVNKIWDKLVQFLQISHLFSIFKFFLPLYVEFIKCCNLFTKHGSSAQ